MGRESYALGRHKDRQTETDRRVGWADRETNRQRQKGRQTNTETDGQTRRQMDGQTNRGADR